MVDGGRLHGPRHGHVWIRVEGESPVHRSSSNTLRKKKAIVCTVRQRQGKARKGKVRTYTLQDGLHTTMLLQVHASTSVRSTLLLRTGHRASAMLPPHPPPCPHRLSRPVRPSSSSTKPVKDSSPSSSPSALSGQGLVCPILSVLTLVYSVGSSVPVVGVVAL